MNMSTLKQLCWMLTLLSLKSVTIKTTASTDAFAFHQCTTTIHRTPSSSSPPPPIPTRTIIRKQTKVDAVKVWVEIAEDGFVDEDENLMMGEICLVAVKAFASNNNINNAPKNDFNNKEGLQEISDGDDFIQEEEDVQENPEGEKRLLCAGALVQRPSSNIRDAWMADSFLDEPNVQIKGATLILDHLFHHHLQTTNAKSLQEILSSFLIQSGRIDSEYHCSSFMAAITRGFKPLKELYNDCGTDDDALNNINDDHNETPPLHGKPYHFDYLNYDDEDSDALVFDEIEGLHAYASFQGQENIAFDDSAINTAASIFHLLQKLNQTVTESILE